MKAWLAAIGTAVFVLVNATSAGAAPATQPGRSFAMVGPARFTGTATDGTLVTIGVQITEAELSPISPPGSNVTAPSGSTFLVVEVQSDEGAGTGPSFNGFDGVPTPDVSLHSAFGMAPANDNATPVSGPLSGTYYFDVPSSITAAQIVVQGATVSAVEYPAAVGASGKLTELTLSPTTIDLALVPLPTTTTPTTSAPPVSSRALRPRPRRAAGALSIPGEIAIGAGSGGGLVLLVIVVPIFVRRRRYDRADREGRVVIDSPPVLVAAPRDSPVDDDPLAIEKTPPERTVVIVGVLGELEFEGLVRGTTSGPVLELLCYLALRPGRSFTAAELRNAIWAEPRSEPTVQSFHNCVSKLRKALPPGALVREEYRYRLTDAVGSDWGMFLAHGAVQDSRASHLRAALALVRGRPFSGVGGRDPDAYNWASTGLVPPMELAIEEATQELVTLALAGGDTALAEWALSRWPPDPPWSVLLEGDVLRVAAAKGGPAGVARAFEATRSHLGDEADFLGDLARELGWEG